MVANLLLRRSALVTRAASSIMRGPSPPLPPFARLPVPSQPLTENHDLIFDDGVAPEMAIDFDCQHISTGEAILTTSAMFGFLAVVFQLIKATDPEGQNPAVNRTVMNMVVEAPKTGKAFFDPV